jgi:hypothetical protein
LVLFRETPEKMASVTNGKARFINDLPSRLIQLEIKDVDKRVNISVMGLPVHAIYTVPDLSCCTKTYELYARLQSGESTKVLSGSIKIEASENEMPPLPLSIIFQEYPEITNERGTDS